jgi:glycogenin
MRVPGTSLAVSPPTSPPSQEFGPPSSFGYHALLDRWFEVYDRQYRLSATSSQTGSAPRDESPLTLTEAPSVPRYTNIWSSDVPPHAEADTSGAGGPLGLEELRRMAISGIGESETGEGEGTYRSMPLEGRIDLMRPPKPDPDSERLLPVVKIIVPEGPQTPVRSFTPMTTLPTPGPNELPPTPLFRGHSLPPETPTHARPGMKDMSYATPEHDHLLPQAQQSPQYDRTSPSMLLRHPPSAPPRHSSPPLIVWNPAVEAPPSAPPPASHFPADTYFPNVWDAQSRSHPAPEDHGGLFPLPPAPSIPEILLKEGHYQAVIGEPKHEEPHPHSGDTEQLEQSEVSEHPPPDAQPTHEPSKHRPPSHPQPDRSKVAVVFPWEEKPRHAPVRFFPTTDSPPPGHSFIKPQPPALELNLRGPPPHLSLPPTLSPQEGCPRTTMYTNAWDVVPSIQRYALRLVRPAHPAAASWKPEAGAASGRDEYRSWQDVEEVSSRDADDEDEDDEEDGLSMVNREHQSETLGDRPQQRYRGRGVQTIPRQMKNQSVQVHPSAKRKHVTWSASGDANRRERVDVIHVSSDDDLAQDARSLASSTQSRSSSASGVTRGGSAQPTALDVKVSDMSTVPDLSPTAARPLTTSTETVSAGTEATSPPSSLGPSPPPEGAPIPSRAPLNATPAVRPAGRTFDPARGVDVFKQGSEEVLARFLKIGSWEDNTATGTGSPSVA